jgi:hypothetical protein
MRKVDTSHSTATIGSVIDRNSSVSEYDRNIKKDVVTFRQLTLHDIAFFAYDFFFLHKVNAYRRCLVCLSTCMLHLEDI